MIDKKKSYEKELEIISSKMEALNRKKLSKERTLKELIESDECKKLMSLQEESEDLKRKLRIKKELIWQNSVKDCFAFGHHQDNRVSFRCFKCGDYHSGTA